MKTDQLPVDSKTKNAQKVSENSSLCDYCNFTKHTKDKYFIVHGCPTSIDCIASQIQNQGILDDN